MLKTPHPCPPADLPLLNLSDYWRKEGEKGGGEIAEILALT